MKRTFWLSLAALFWLPSSLLAQTAAFTTSGLQGCSPLLVQFDAAGSTGMPPLSYSWDFGNGNNTSGPGEQQPGAVYVQPGTYTVTLTVTDATGQSSPPFSRMVTVFANPMANFTLSDSLGCPPFAVQFTDLSTSGSTPITEWIWDFGDGNSALSASPTHLYGPGSFPVSLIVRDANGCQDVVVRPNLVSVYPAIDAQLTATGPRRTCDPTLSTGFIASVQGNAAGPYGYAWDLGDGNTATGPAISHSYTGFGSYAPQLIVTDQGTGCQDTATLNGGIQLIQENIQVQAATTAGCAPFTLSLDHLTTYLGPGQTISWNFGDGSTLTGPATDPALLSPSHTYAVPGSYAVSLSLDLGPDLCVQTFTLPDSIEVGAGTTAAFTADQQASCRVPFPVQFTPQSPDATSWWWDFGDGDTSTQANPSHTYTTLGAFPVTLAVTNAVGCTDTLTLDSFIVVAAPQAAFTNNLDANIVFPDMWDGRDPSVIRGGCLPLPVDFADASYSPTPIIDWQWSFGDGNGQNGLADPTHTYLNEGEFDVSLIITTADGCQDTVSCDSCIRAGNLPTAMLDTTAYPMLACCDPATLFQNTTSSLHDFVWYSVTTGDYHGVVLDDTTNGDWDFGTTVPVFVDSGQYVSTMFYAYNYGCVDSFFLEDWVMLQPPYGSAGIDMFACESNWPPGGTVVFDTSNTNYIPDTSYIDSVLWEFGDPAGSTSNELYPTFTYPDTGAYWLTVTVWNYEIGCSCRVSGEQFLQIVVLPDTTFMINQLSGCAPLDVALTGPTAGVDSWQWFLNGNQVSTDADPNLVLDSVGSYDLRLVVRDQEGCADTTQQVTTLEVAGITPRISADRLSGCAPFSVTFSDRSLSTAPIVSRTWELGDGTVFTGNDSVLTYSYPQAPLPPSLQREGVPVVLSLTDSAGCTGSDTLWLTITQPLAAWQDSLRPGCQGDTIQFQALSGDSLGLAPFSYQWQFPNQDNDTARIAERYFPGGGPYPVSLTVTDSLGCTATRLDTLTIVPDPPQANFSAFPIEATCPPLVVNFTDLSVPGRSPLTQWSWEFGDGTQSGLSSPTRIFASEGSYDVRLTVTDARGCTGTFDIPDLIQLTGVTGDFVMDNDIICQYGTVTFAANSPNATHFIWDFGDGSIAEGPSATHLYERSGTLYPILVMEDSSGNCSRSVRDTLTVYPSPFVPEPEDVAFCAGESATLDVFQPGVSYRWSMGDTTSSIGVSEAGRYAVEVYFAGTNCRADSFADVTVWPLPTVDLGPPVEICEGDTLQLTAASPDSLLSYRWNQPSLLGGAANERWLAPRAPLEVSVSVRDANGCPAADTTAVAVIPIPQIDLSFEPLCEGDTLWLDATPSNIDDPQSQYAWFRAGLPADVTTPQLAVTEADVYSVYYELRGCTAEETTEVFFHPLPPGGRYYEQLNCVYKGQPVILDAGPAYAYRWAHSQEITRRVAAVPAQTYDFLVFNEFGCSTPDSVAVIDACPPTLFVPTAFTPNYDGHNERFKWGGDYLATFDMKIFSRWGVLIYQTNDQFAFWDGSHGGKVVPEGVYTWVATYSGTHPDWVGRMLQQVGTVTVYR